LADYQIGKNSLEIQMEYRPVMTNSNKQCRLPTSQEMFQPDLLRNVIRISTTSSSESLLSTMTTTTTTTMEEARTSSSNIDTSSAIHVIFVGDSNIRMQHALFQKYFGGASSFSTSNNTNNKVNITDNTILQTTYIATNGGLKEKLPEIRATLNMIRQSHSFRPEKTFILFNAGLHEIAMYCDNRSDSHSKSGQCASDYQRYIRELIQLIYSIPAVLHLWQSTTASWPKYGVYGVTWPTKSYQTLPKSPEMCHYFNQLAHDILQEEVQLYLQALNNTNINNYNNNNNKHHSTFLQSSPPSVVSPSSLPSIVPILNNSVLVMDAYWITYSRPDHRQIDDESRIANKLMHAGPEVYSVLMRQWAAIIIDLILQQQAK
jgi:hypothetical protein